MMRPVVALENPHGQLPLNVVLTAAFFDLTSEIPASSDHAMQVSTLEVHANLLSHLDEQVLTRDLPVRSGVTKRAVRYIADRARRGGMVVTDRQVMARTERGDELVGTVRRSIDEGTRAWAARHATNTATLRSPLESLVAALDLELPHYPLATGPPTQARPVAVVGAAVPSLDDPGVRSTTPSGSGARLKRSMRGKDDCTLTGSARTGGPSHAGRRRSTRCR